MLELAGSADGSRPFAPLGDGRGEGRGAKGWEKFGRARKRDTMLGGMTASSGEVRRAEAARVELCVRELRGIRKEGGGRGGGMLAVVIDSNDVFAPRATARV